MLVRLTNFICLFDPRNVSRSFLFGFLQETLPFELRLVSDEVFLVECLSGSQITVVLFPCHVILLLRFGQRVDFTYCAANKWFVKSGG